MIRRTLGMLRAQRSALVALVVLISLSEPAACLMHCRMLSLPAQSAHGHTRAASGLAVTGQLGNAFAHAGAQLLPSLFLCDFTRVPLLSSTGPDDRQTPLAPSDSATTVSHEHLALAAVTLALLIIVLALIFPVPLRSTVPSRSQPPRHPPPILLLTAAV